MSTWDYMSEADYAACQDAGRTPVTADEIDYARKAAKENGERPICGICGTKYAAPGATACRTCGGML